MRHPDDLTAELAPQGFEPFEGWRETTTAYCPGCSPPRLAAGQDQTHTDHRIVAYRNPDPIHDGSTWDWREYGQCTECGGEWRLLVHDRVG